MEKSNNIYNNNFIEELNSKIYNVTLEKNQMNIDYDLLMNCLKGMLIKRRVVNEPKKYIEKYLSREEMISICLQFFKSVDFEFYNKASNLVLQQTDKTKLCIYNKNKITNFNEKDENGMYKYEYGGKVSTKNGNTIVHIPIKSDNYCILEELYILVHEIAHTFDLNANDTVPTKEGIENNYRKNYRINPTRELLAETIPIAFEGILTEYLLKKDCFSKKEIERNATRRIRNSFSATELLFYKLYLAKEQEENGEITSEWIEEQIHYKKLNEDWVNRILNDIVNDKSSIQFTKRYAIAGLISPTISKLYLEHKEKGAEILKNYIECIKNNNLKGALNVIGIDNIAENIDKLTKIAREQEDSFREIER